MNWYHQLYSTCNKLELQLELQLQQTIQYYRLHNSDRRGVNCVHLHACGSRAHAGRARASAGAGVAERLVLYLATSYSRKDGDANPAFESSR